MEYKFEFSNNGFPKWKFHFIRGLPADRSRDKTGNCLEGIHQRRCVLATDAPECDGAGVYSLAHGADCTGHVECAADWRRTGRIGTFRKDALLKTSFGGTVFAVRQIGGDRFHGMPFVHLMVIVICLHWTWLRAVIFLGRKRKRICWYWYWYWTIVPTTSDTLNRCGPNGKEIHPN
ncbi:hypothetical protein C8R47DRAFT_70075 [Mycena vitilis]|nr:hypothetical protein C8R47DRAFT_70075 [Mycena vitilis]